MALLYAVLTFLFIAVAFSVTVYLGTGARRQETVRRRLEAIEKAQKRGSTPRDLELMRDELLSEMPWLHRLLFRWAGAHRLRMFLSQAGLKLKPGKLMLMSGVLALSTYLILAQVYGSLLLGAMAGIAAGLIPFGGVAIKRQQRLRQFERHLPEAIDLLSRALRAGHAFSTGLEMIGKELAEPLAGEFRTTFEEQNFGLPLRDALLNLSERVPSIDVRFFVTAVLIQKETGGNLAEILDNLGGVIRERFRIKGEVRIRTAQGRLTAIILIGLPPAMILLLKGVNPGYVDLLFTDPWGPYMLAFAAVLQVIGSVLLWKIVHIEV